MLWMKGRFYVELQYGLGMFRVGVRVSKLSGTLALVLGLGFLSLVLGARPEVLPESSSSSDEMKTAA